MNISRTIKIGFCDSGIGGLILAIDFLKYVSPFLFAIHEAHNIKFEFYHICDGFPYGNKSDEEIIVIGSRMIHKLQRKIGCNVFVVACNTLSAKLDLYNIKFESYRNTNFKIVPIVQNSSSGIYYEALENTKKYNTKDIEIMMLATKAAFRNNLHEKYIKYEHYRAKKNNQTDKDLIVKSFTPEIFWQQNVENGVFLEAKNLLSVENDLKNFLIEANLDNLNAIGFFCTHYPAYKDIITKIIPSTVNIVSQGKLIMNSVIDAIFELFPEFKIVNIRDIRQVDASSFLSLYSIYKSDSYSNIIKTTICEIFGKEFSNLIQIIR